MAAVGFDFGTLHSKIGVARQRGIDIITNEVSNRATPSLIAFGPKQRSIGESAKTQETSNFKNTIGSLKHLIGRSVNDPDITNHEKKFINASLVDVGGSVGVEVNYLGERQTFSATQLVAAYFGKLRDTTSAELKTGMSDVVIAVPGWYSDRQRRAIIDAASAANLKVLRIINDTTAAALGYGITKSDLPDIENPRHVVFIDAGHSTFSVSVVAFSKGRLDVKSSAYNHHLGGRDIDYALVQHFAEEFKGKYKIDTLSSPKAIFRLTAACEKLKKVLSANTEAVLNVESIMNDVDASSKLSRNDFEALISHVLDGIKEPLNDALVASGLTPDQIDAIELIGGSTRVPAVRAKIQEVFPGRALSTTLNQDEAVTRGATFACAMLSPVFRVREFSIYDANHHAIKVHWEATPTEPDDTELVVFPRGNIMPSTKILTFYRNEPFDLEASYSEPSLVPGGHNPWIAKFSSKDIPTTVAGGESVPVKVKTRLSQHGIVSFEAAYVEVQEEKEEPAPEAMDVDKAEGAAPPAPKKKKYVRKLEVPFVASNSSFDVAGLEALREHESQMHASDKLVMDTEDRKNALEEYVYDMRSKVEDRYAAYVQEEEKAKLLAALQTAEDWLYSEEGEDATKSAYVERLSGLKVLGDPISTRYFEAEGRARAASALRETLNDYMTKATSGDEKYAHIEVKDLESVVERVATIQKWLEDQMVRQSEKPKNVDPILKVAEIEKKRDEVIYFCTPILMKPKPKPPVIPTPGASGTNTPKEQPEPQPDAEKTKAESEAAGKPKAEGEAPGPSEMDVD